MADFQNANEVIGEQGTLAEFSMIWWAWSLAKRCKQSWIGWASFAAEPSTVMA